MKYLGPLSLMFVLVLTAFFIDGQGKTIKMLNEAHEGRMTQYEELFKEQRRGMNDCMASLSEGERKEIYRKHWEELQIKVEEYLRKIKEQQ